MKTLTLKQPFAELVISGKKTIELRNWSTKFRGKFLIHASKSPDKKAMKQFGFNELPCGFVIGEAELIDVKKYLSKEEFEKDKDLHLATQDFGIYGFILKNFRKIEPIEAKGRLGFWDYDKSYKRLLLISSRVKNE
ncbi:MAG: ASCH domain-containing protein [Candidatus Pacearchaeota archaeon]